MNFSQVNYHHKRLAELTKFLLKHTKSDPDEINKASELLNAEICKLYKKNLVGG